MKYADLHKFTRSPNYKVMVDWKYLEHTIERWSDERDGLCKLNMNPDFQRAHVWTKAQQSAYVEYVLKGGFSGRDIYFNCVGWQGSYKGPFFLVDGKQRIEAVRAYLRDEIMIFNGALYRDFTDIIPNTAWFNFCVNDLKTKAEVLTWYLEMNTGGTPHTSAEIQIVRELLAAENKPALQITTGHTP